MENSVEYPKATLESVWAAFRETDRLLKESHVEFNREMAESRAEFDKGMKELKEERKEAEARFNREMAESNARFEASRADFDRRMKNLGEMIGGVSNSNGTFAEDCQ